MNTGHQAAMFEAPSATEAASRSRGIETRFDVVFAAEQALKEKQIQQNVRPTIAVHKWFARRPGTLFRSLLLAEFGSGDVRSGFFAANDFAGLVAADPFMGGGTPLVEANRLGMGVHGWDINPIAFWIVREVLRPVSPAEYQRRTEAVYRELSSRLGSLYETECPSCQGPARAKYFIWFKRATCRDCGSTNTIFPGSVIGRAGRHPKNVFVCQGCAELFESADTSAKCPNCSRPTSAAGNYSRGAWKCTTCQASNPLPAPAAGPPDHEMVAIEVYCDRCSGMGNGRLFKRPRSEDLDRFARASRLLAQSDQRWIPEEKIEAGDETDRLLRWGYSSYRELFNPRQLYSLSVLAAQVASEDSDEMADAFATNVSDLVRYQNMLCRYDTKALKSLDVFSVHGFPVGLVQCESNVLGIRGRKPQMLVGSGGWLNITGKYLRALQYCEAPFETRYQQGTARAIEVRGEQIGPTGAKGRKRHIALRCASSTNADLESESFDIVVTDPPYFANVQYAELMDFCYVWLRKLVRTERRVFSRPSTRRADELTGNVTQGRGIAHFTAGLSDVFLRFANALKSGRPFVFTYHHNRQEAYDPIAVALLDARLVVTRAIPCPAEMGGSIHIQGTNSSILDTVFVCRRSGVVRTRDLASDLDGLRELVRRDLMELSSAGIRATRGDARCLTYGHLVRLAVWSLRQSWDRANPVDQKLQTVKAFCGTFGEWTKVVDRLATELQLPERQRWEVREAPLTEFEEVGDAISF